MPAMLCGRDHWIFDLDGTLTVAIHDFAAIRRELDLPEGLPILEALAELPDPERRWREERLDRLELELAKRAIAAPGARALLDELTRRGARLGILTRNSLENARITLAACGLEGLFPKEWICARELAAPKPDPAGIRRLLAGWDAMPSQTVMVGDYLFDLQAGRAAGVLTVWIDTHGSGAYSEEAELTVRSPGEILAHV